MTVTAKPTVHLNGTAPISLLHGYETAHSAVSEAINKIALTCPNKRDYYVQKAGDAAFRLAVSEHHDRVRKLTEVLTDLYSLMEEVSQ
jgi:hypothetical protein